MPTPSPAVRDVRHLGDFTATPRMLYVVTLAVPIGVVSAGASWCLLRLIGDDAVGEAGELMEAPAYALWGQNIRSGLVRVPLYKRGKANTARVEFRLPDSACNPYLTFALMLAAGLRGIQGGYELPSPAGDDVWTLTDTQRRERGIRPLPGSLAEAIAVMESSALVRDTLGDDLFEFFLRNKRAEWGAYRRQVSQFEINRYLPLL